jgi:hypothetical protein
VGTVVPFDLVRLRSATATFVAILNASLPALESLASADPEPDQQDTGLARLRDSIEAALDIDDSPGTPASILTTLCHLLGSIPPTAGAGCCLRSGLPHP